LGPSPNHHMNDSLLRARWVFITLPDLALGIPAT
jgi:hypothetical protein